MSKGARMPDSRVQAAIEHWAPRFVLHGVDFNDFQRTTARVESWEGWLDAWSQLAEQHLALAREAEQAGHRLTAGEAHLRAAVAFHFGKFVWVLDEERHREATRRSIAALADAHRLLDPTAERVEAPLDGASVVANLRRPAAVQRPPLVVLITGLDSTKEEFFHLEQVFLRRGMATLSLDGPGQGETGFELPIRPDYEVAVAAILDAVADRRDLDLDRTGAVGVSLGGYYAPRAAVFEPRVKAVAGISGPFHFGECWEGLPPLTRETFARKSGARDEDEARTRAGELDLEPVIDSLAQPALMVTGRLDRLIPWEQTERIARRARNGRFVLYEEGNHGVADLGHRSRPLVADWMSDQLGAGAGERVAAGAHVTG
jgi:dipeptidyl aminopeptidase/acylaminoacyl peptidase